MRIAILSDIHGNHHALRAVLDDLDGAAADEIWCLGDVVGYGADPDACCAAMRERAAVCLAGNHDLAVTGALATDEFTRGAAMAVAWTQETIAPDHLAWLQSLSSSARRHDIELFHASPREPVWEYVLDPLTAALSMDLLRGDVGLIGHSHVALSYGRPPLEDAQGHRRADGEHVDLGGAQWLLNPGSVGQPRDGDARAAWLDLDLGAGTATWHRTEYDIAGAQAAIRAARLPESLAERLEHGQ